ncbi:hypothetical protein GCM10010433_07980 [Streptomyces pulveraceus]|uniref:Uncharacterized protein n=1 Tax=Streptomyces pulveraceus TaxID=68258 RepID=A0ABW1GIH7_9ACTN
MPEEDAAHALQYRVAAERLLKNFDEALGLIKAALGGYTSKAAYICTVRSVQVALHRHTARAPARERGGTGSRADFGDGPVGAAPERDGDGWGDEFA